MTNSNWFRASDILPHFESSSYNIIPLHDLHGYVLPHAATQYTGRIIAHTLRFKPTKHFSQVYILFYPANPKDTAKTAHEYEVPYKSCLSVFKYIWGIDTKNLKFIPYNIADKSTQLPQLTLSEYKKSLVIVSADFSHFLDLQTAYKAENCAANTLTHNASPPPKCIDIVDHRASFERLYSFLPNSESVRPVLQWVGRTRSPGAKGVGYLSFLLRDEHIVDSSSGSNAILPDGIFVTCYDENMTARECLGKWFDTQTISGKRTNMKWTKRDENELIADVIKKGGETSRLTGGREYDKDIPIRYCTITYLYRDTKSRPEDFIRGWHGLLASAFYLPEVFLEHTFDNGAWINETDVLWPQDYDFKLDETMNSLDRKAGVPIGTSKRGEKKLYTSALRYVRL
jgi:hypothetical protein